MGEVNCRMLIVDDNPDHRALLQLNLRRSGRGLQVEEAGSFREGRVRLSAESFDCALVDLKLPDGDGRDLIASAGTTPVVIVTSADDELLGSEAIAMGAQDYLVKDRLDGAWLRQTLQLAMDRKHKQLRQAEAEHAHRVAALGRLAGAVGHEINNPASIVMLGLDSMGARLQRLPWAEAERNDMLETLADCRDAMKRIVSVVRHMTVVSSPGVTRRGAGSFDLDALIDSVCSLAGAGHEVVIEKRGACLGLYRGRASEISQALLAVLDNAVRATLVGGTVVVHCSADSSQLVIRVVDEGPGIAADISPRVFEPFFTTRPMGEGTGLGLPVARSAVREHGGVLELTATSSSGTTFELRLPRQTGSSH